MRTDRRTDMPKLIFAFRNFANAPKMDSSTLSISYACCTKGGCKVPVCFIASSLTYVHLNRWGQLRDSSLEQAYT